MWGRKRSGNTSLNTQAVARAPHPTQGWEYCYSQHGQLACFDVKLKQNVKFPFSSVTIGAEVKKVSV